MTINLRFLGILVTIILAVTGLSISHEVRQSNRIFEAQQAAITAAATAQEADRKSTNENQAYLTIVNEMNRRAEERSKREEQLNHDIREIQKDIKKIIGKIGDYN